jgi:ubiquinone/menaquinone biosynthesis C-methylase UbiE
MLTEPGQLPYLDRTQPFIGSRVDLLQSWIPRDAKTILDLGCAFGYISTRLATSARRVYGIDVNYKYIAEAHSSYRNAAFFVGAAEAIPFADSFFDCIAMTEVLEHVADEPRSLAEVCRVLVPGGTLLLTVPHRGPLSFLDPENILIRLPGIHRFLYRLKWGSTGGMLPKTREHRHYSLESIQGLLGTAFVVEEVYTSGFLVYSLATLLKLFFKKGRLVSMLDSLMSWDYAHQFGSISCNLALRARRL